MTHYYAQRIGPAIQHAFTGHIKIRGAWEKYRIHGICALHVTAYEAFTPGRQQKTGGLLQYRQTSMLQSPQISLQYLTIHSRKNPALHSMPVGRFAKAEYPGMRNVVIMLLNAANWWKCKSACGR